MTINIVSSDSVPPVVEVVIPFLVELQVGIEVVVIHFIVSSVHHVVHLITAVEVTTSFTWALLDLIAGSGNWVPLLGLINAAVRSLVNGSVVAASGVGTSTGGWVEVIHINGAAVSSLTRWVIGVSEPFHDLVASRGDVLTACGFISNTSVGVLTPVVFTTLSFSVAFLVIWKLALGLIWRTAEILINADVEDWAVGLIIRAAWVADGDALKGLITPFLSCVTTVVINRNTFLKDFAPFFNIWFTAVRFTIVGVFAPRFIIWATVLQAVFVDFTPEESCFFVAAFLIRAKASCVAFIINIMAANLCGVVSALGSRITIDQ